MKCSTEREDGALEVDGEVVNKKILAPLSCLSLAETAMAERVKPAVHEWKGMDTTLYGTQH